MNKKPFEIGPASLAQEIFLNSEADINIASGSAGSSKSFGLLLAFLKHSNDPHTTAVLFRRTYGQALMPGGIWTEACNLFSQVDPGIKIKVRDLELVMSSGARLKMMAYESDDKKEKMKGMAASLLLIDEASEFSEEAITYLRSRNRNFKVKYKPKMFLATNPHVDAPLKRYVMPWLDKDTGIPDPAQRGKVRYYVRNGNDLHWADTRAELEAIYGSGDGMGITSVMVVGSTVYDNPFLLKADPDYVSRLKALSKVETDRLLYGSWFSRESASNYFKREWVPAIYDQNYRVTQRVRAWDTAGTLPSGSNPDPDFTVGVLMAKTADKRYVIEDVIRFRGRFHEVEQKILETARNDGTAVTICLPRDPGPASLAYASAQVQKLAEQGFHCKIKPTNKSKLDRFRPFSALAEAGVVDLLKGDWNEHYLFELESFSGDGKGHDDCVDATSDAFSSLRNQTELPNFTLPNLTRSSGFDMSRSLGIA